VMSLYAMSYGPFLLFAGMPTGESFSNTVPLLPFPSISLHLFARAMCPNDIEEWACTLLDVLNLPRTTMAKETRKAMKILQVMRPFNSFLEDFGNTYALVFLSVCRCGFLLRDRTGGGLVLGRRRDKSKLSSFPPAPYLEISLGRCVRGE